MEDCIFCKIIKGEIPCFKIYENDDVLSFADINPISDGHALIIPKRHYENIWEIPEDDLIAVHRASKKVAAAMSAAIQPAGIAFLQLNGKAVNQEVPHYHLHLVPRAENGPALPTVQWELKPGDMDAIKEIAENIASFSGDNE